MRRSSLIFITLFLITATACQNSPNATHQATPLPTTQLQSCRTLFNKAAALTIALDNATSEEKQAISQEIPKIIVEAGETFLNECTVLSMPLADQLETLEKLRQISQVIPLSKECKSRYTPTFQLMDLNKDNLDELILHTQAAFCSAPALDGFNGGGGVSIIFSQDHQSQNWTGTLVVPCSGESCDWTIFHSESPKPQIQPLTIFDAPGQAFTLVESGYLGGDHTGKTLTIWRWQDNKAEFAWGTIFTDWCGRSNDWKTNDDGNQIFSPTWEITEEGRIFVPAAEETERCPAEPAKLIVLQGDAFVIKEQ